MGVVPEATYTVHNLFEGLFLMSGNDAANALANAGGGVPETVAAMNATARELGARDTTAVNPSGLDAPHQFTTSYDLALIARAALQRPDFQSYADDGQVEVPRQDAQEGQEAPGLRDLHAEQAGPQLPRRDRRQDRLDDQGQGDVRRRRGARRPDG